MILSITNNSIEYLSFVHTQLNDQTVLFQTIQIIISQMILSITNNSIGCLSFVYTELNDQTLLFKQFKVS